MKKEEFESWPPPWELKAVYRCNTWITITMGIPMTTVTTTLMTTAITIITTILTITTITIKAGRELLWPPIKR